MRKRERGRRVPPQLRGLALLLSLLVFCFNFIPISAYAKSGFVQWSIVGFRCLSSSNELILSSDNGIGSYSGTVKQTELSLISLSFIFDEEIEANTVITVDTEFSYSRYAGFGYFDALVYPENESPSYYKASNFSYTYNNPKLSVSFTLPVDVKTGSAVSIRLSKPITYVGNQSNNPVSFGLKKFVVSAESEQTGFFNNIIQWLKDIVDKIKGLPDAIGSFINSLGDKISSFFSNLINNLKTWFDNIGKWFTDLGNNIKQWFIDIGDKIGGFFTAIWDNIVEFFTNLFKPRDEYFDELREDLDNHMSEHLGAVYNVPKALIEQLTSIVNGVKGSDPNHLYIAIPEFAFRLKGEKRVLLEAQQFDLLSSINSIEEGSTKSIINVALVIMHGMIDLFLAVACFRMVYKKIINKVGIEGGDDL